MADNLDQSFPLLQEILNSLSQSVDQPQTSVSELISFLNSTLDAALSDPENEDAKANTFRALIKVHQFVSSPSLDQFDVYQLFDCLPKRSSKHSSLSCQWRFQISEASPMDAWRSLSAPLLLYQCVVHETCF
ncbi:hypothetical protein ACFX2F_046722 [Malus domestica]